MVNGLLVRQFWEFIHQNLNMWSWDVSQQQLLTRKLIFFFSPYFGKWSGGPFFPPLKISWIWLYKKCAIVQKIEIPINRSRWVVCQEHVIFFWWSNSKIWRSSRPKVYNTVNFLEIFTVKFIANRPCFLKYGGYRILGITVAVLYDMHVAVI